MSGRGKGQRAKSTDGDEITLALIECLSDENVLRKLRKALEPNSDEISNKVSSMIGQHFKVLQEQISEKNARIVQLEKKVEELIVRYDDLEQYSRRNMIRITGIEEKAGEDTDELVMKMANDLMDTPLDILEIDHSHRVGPKSPGKDRTILVKLATYRSKAKLVTNRRKLNSARVSQVLPTHGNKVYINDDLTKRRTQLLYKARMLKRENKINDAWTYDGRILVKDKVNKIVPISNELDLVKVSELANVPTP